MSKYNTNKNKYLAKSERASVPKITKKQKGSITIEAAFAIPLFLFAALCLIWMIEIQSIKIGVKQAAYSAAKSAAEDTAVIPVLNTIKLKSDIIRLLGKERIERSIIVDGSEGISCWNSYLSSKTGEMNIHVKYEVRVPLPLFGNPSAKMEETFRIHGWTGYGKDKKTEDSEIVYITEKQSVYHEDYHCSYLQLSIRFVPYEQLEEIRNENGGIYYACEKCVYGDASTGVYITENGSKYHNSLGCSGLKFDNDTIKKVTRLVCFHDYRTEATPANVRRAMNRIGVDLFPYYLAVRMADAKAQSSYRRREKIENIVAMRKFYQEAIIKDECVTLRQLAVSGRDLMNLGMRPGVEIGRMLSELLEYVIDNPEKNDKKILCNYVKKKISQRNKTV